MGAWVNQSMYAVDPAKLRGLRRSWFMSQPEFADLVGLDPSTISNMEGGGVSKLRKHGVRGTTIRKIMKATGCCADDLLVEQ